jgi:hypothetical protein
LLVEWNLGNFQEKVTVGKDDQYRSWFNLKKTRIL